ncbi:MAG: NAD-dependent epimerase/dehydratase family protein [Anaerolineae bacterium]|nr:NAD-dependent epimerase/dehydratase family protein [Anaerolineae bacterium]
MKKRILVTGAAGFMGSHLVDHLVAEGHDVYGVDDMSGGFWRNVNPGSTFHRLDLRDKGATCALVEEIRPQVVYHLAADATEGRSQFTPIACTERNYLAYLNVLVPAIQNGLERMVVTSSMSVYGAQEPPFNEDMAPAPEDIYGIAKAAMEKATEILSTVHGFEYVIIRPHNVYGPRQNIADPYRNVIGIFINRLLQGKGYYIYGDGEQKRAFTYVDDFTPYMAYAGFSPRCRGEVINLGPRQEYSINEMSDTLLDLFYEGRTPEIEPIYLPDRPQEVKEAYCTVEKAERLLGYEAKVSLREGMSRMLSWARELGPQQPRYLEEGLELTTGDVPVTWRDRLI